MGFEVVVDGEQRVFLTLEEIKNFAIKGTKQPGTREIDHIRIEVETQASDEA